MFQLKNMKIKFTAVLLCLTLFLCAFAGLLNAARAEEAQPEAKPRIVGYLPDWSYQAYKDIDFTTLTHINISFCNVKGNALACSIPDSEMRAIVNKAHTNNVKVMAALGGGGNSDYRDLISSSAKITSLNEKIVAFCEKYGLDGVDLDIEIASGDSIWNNYGAWVASLRSICDERGWELSTATAQWVAGSVSEQTFALFDFINVMAYDDDSQGRNSHSSYEFAVECLNYFNGVKKIPKEKLVLGVPFYGRGYNDNGSLDWNSYESFSDLVKADEANYQNDEYMGVAYTGALTMHDKCALAKDYGGVMIWEISMDAEGEYSLLKLIKNELYPVNDSNVTPPDNSEPKKDRTALWIGLGVGAAALIGAGIAVSIIFVKKKK